MIDSQRGGSRASMIGVFVVEENRIWWEEEERGLGEGEVGWYRLI